MSIDERAKDPKDEETQNLPERPVTDADADDVKGGMSGGGTRSPILVKQINPREIAPCI
jgi:hypothetical protein